MKLKKLNHGKYCSESNPNDYFKTNDKVLCTNEVIDLKSDNDEKNCYMNDNISNSNYNTKLVEEDIISKTSANNGKAVRNNEKYYTDFKIDNKNEMKYKDQLYFENDDKLKVSQEDKKSDITSIQSEEYNTDERKKNITKVYQSSD